MVLSRENIARGPANLGAQCLERFDKDAGLDRHVQRTRNSRSVERTEYLQFLANGHETRHFRFGDPEFLMAPCSERHVCDNDLRA